MKAKIYINKIFPSWKSTTFIHISKKKFVRAQCSTRPTFYFLIIELNSPHITDIALLGIWVKQYHENARYMLKTKCDFSPSHINVKMLSKHSRYTALKYKQKSVMYVSLIFNESTLFCVAADSLPLWWLKSATIKRYRADNKQITFPPLTTTSNHHSLPGVGV